ncbi:hypothetical protein NLI96_g9640 [Meripilus lineatus]|uniref:Peptidase C14 caspase domain-containing protein n=1 Tax=Meripilus lineatus TaxID=2056292 RepID=A0AAD5UVC2_9APHY|nr:hypothetical protein NLI96_g9640 [Physisporinus lineatus]
MWNNGPPYGNRGFDAPGDNPGGFPAAPQHEGYAPSYSPSYGPPPGPPPAGYGQYPPPPGPPPINHRGYPGQQYHQQNQGYGPPGGTPGFPSPGGPPPPIPPRFPGPPGPPQQHHGPPPGQYGGYGPPPGPPGGAPHRPPTQQQAYGPRYEGANHQMQQPFFQYSQCTGRKKALCIGINYIRQQNELKGCINDARNVQRFLISQFHYKEEDIVMLTDDAANPRQKPTGANIDKDGDEADGFDEVIYPADFQTNGHIVDDLMHDIMVKPLPAGCRLTAIFDSCHSGSALDLPYIYSTEGKVKEPNLAAEAGQGLMSAVSSYARGDMGGVFSSVTGILKTATGSTQKAEKKARQTKTSPADVISWSGCKDSQTSADTFEGGQSTGAMSFERTPNKVTSNSLSASGKNISRHH